MTDPAQALAILQKEREKRASDPLAAAKAELASRKAGGQTSSTPKESKTQQVLRLLTHGGLSGLGDETTAGIKAGIDWAFQDKPFKETYSQNLKHERGMLDKAREDLGWLGSMGAETVGAIPTSVAGAAYTVPMRAKSLFAAPATRIGSGAASGALGGGLFGFGEGEGGFQNRLMSSVLPGSIGGALGAAAPITSSIVSKLKGTKHRKKLAKETGVAEDIIDEVQDVIDTSVQDTGGKLRYGSGASSSTKGHVDSSKIADDVGGRMMLDMGPAARGMFNETVRKTGGGFRDMGGAEREGMMHHLGLEEVPTAAEIRERVAARARDASAVFRDSLDERFGKVKGMREVEEQLKSNPDIMSVLTGDTKAVAVPGGSGNPMTDAYSRAWKTPIDYQSPQGQALKNLVKIGRVNKSLVSKAEETLSLNGHTAPRGSMQWWDAIKREADAIAKTEKASLGIGAVSTTPKGQGYQGIARTIRGTLGEISPDYEVALKLAVKPKQATEALKLGHDAFKNLTTVSPEDLRSAMKDMTPEQTAFIKQGGREALNDIMGRIKEGFVPAPSASGRVSRQTVADTEGMGLLKMLSSQNFRDKIDLVLGPESAGKFADELDDVAAAIEARGSMEFNLKEFASELRQKGIDRYEKRPSTLMGRGQPVQAGVQAMREATGIEPLPGLNKVDRTDALMADFLTSKMDKDVLSTLHGSKSAGQVERASRKKLDQWGRMMPWLFAPTGSNAQLEGMYP